MYEDDEGRIDAAEQLAEHNPHAAAEAFSAIACDQTVGDEVRLSAAQQLADVDPSAAAPACLAIAGDGMVGDEVRLSAAELVADVDPRAAAPACLAIAGDGMVGDEVRLSVRRRAAGRRRSERSWPGLPGHRPRWDGRRRGAPVRGRATRGPRPQRLNPRATPRRCDAANRHASLAVFSRTDRTVPDYGVHSGRPAAR